MALLTIDGVEMPEPMKYSFPMQDVQGDTAVNEKGVQFRSCVRQGVRAIDLAWMADGEQAAILLGAVTPDKDKVSVTFFDPRENGFKTADMFVGDRSCELASFGGAKLWSVGFTLTEF